MGIRIYQQPDGQYAAYSTTVDNFLLEDASAEELEEWYVEQKVREAREQAEDDIKRMLVDADTDEHRVGGPASYEEAAERAGN